MHVASHDLPASAPQQDQPRCLFLFNADAGEVAFVLPRAVAGPWRVELDTSGRELPGSMRYPGDVVALPPYSAVVYQARPGP